MEKSLAEISAAAFEVARASGDHGIDADDHDSGVLLNCIERQQAAIEALERRMLQQQQGAAPDATISRLEAKLREADRAFEKLASAARRLLYDISLEDHPMPDSAAALADLVFERDAPTDETADAAGEED